MAKVICGVDVSKAKFDVALRIQEKVRCACFNNTIDGFEAFNLWLKKETDKDVWVCMEATGGYEKALAEFCFIHAHSVSVVNPACIRAYGQSKLKRHKTDGMDAQLIAEYSAKESPHLWVMETPEQETLRSYYRCLQELKEEKQTVENRLDKPTHNTEVTMEVREDLIASYKKHIAEIEAKIMEFIQENETLRQQHDLMCSIPGIGHTTAVGLLAELPPLSSFHNARQLAAFVGVTPRHKTSGSSVHGRPKLSKMGSSTVRKMLYFPAIVAKKHNPLLHKFTSLLAEKSKPPMVIIGACMRKLLHIIFGVLKSGKPFDKNIIKEKNMAKTA